MHDASKVPNLLAHYERHLGSIQAGYVDRSKSHGIQVVKFDDQPDAGVSTLATVGVAENILVSINREKSLRQELLTSFIGEEYTQRLANALLNIAERCIESCKFIKRGEILHLPDDVLFGKSLLATNPLASFDVGLTKNYSSTPPTVFVYMIAITPKESDLAKSHGWSYLEDYFEAESIDIWDLKRA